MKNQSSTLPQNHELGSHRATFYRVKTQKGTVASFQHIGDAIMYADAASYTTGTPHEIWASHHFEHGIEETLSMVSNPV